MTSYGFNQNFTAGSFGGGGFGGGFSFSYIPATPPYLPGVKKDYYDSNYYADDPYWFNYETPSDTTYPEDAIVEPFNGFDPPNNFSVRWTGYFKAPATETYTFYLESDDASHMWIGPSAKVGWSSANVFIDNGGIHGSNEVSNTIALVSGSYYPIQVFLGEYSGGSLCTFSYSTNTIAKTSDLTGLIYYSQDLDPFLRGIENKTSTTLITRGSVTINGTVFSWPTFDFTGSDPAGWYTLIVQNQSPLQKIYAISGSGSLGGPSQSILDLVGRGDLSPGTPLVCANFVTATGSLGVGDYGIRSDCELIDVFSGSLFTFTGYLSGNIHLPGGNQTYTWADTYGAPPPNPESVILAVQISPRDSNIGSTGSPVIMIISLAPPPV